MRVKRGERDVKVPTSALVFLIVLLPLVAILLAQANIECDDCAWWRDALALLTIPTALAWLVVLLALLWRAARRLRGKAH